MNYGVLGGSWWPVYSSEGNSERTFETAQDGNTTRLCLPKYSQPHQTNWRYAKYRNLLLMKGISNENNFNYVAIPVFIFGNVACSIAMAMTV